MVAWFAVHAGTTADLRLTEGPAFPVWHISLPLGDMARARSLAGVALQSPFISDTRSAGGGMLHMRWSDNALETALADVLARARQQATERHPDTAAFPPLPAAARLAARRVLDIVRVLHRLETNVVRPAIGAASPTPAVGWLEALSGAEQRRWRNLAARVENWLDAADRGRIDVCTHLRDGVVEDLHALHRTVPLVSGGGSLRTARATALRAVGALLWLDPATLASPSCGHLR